MVRSLAARFPGGQRIERVIGMTTMRTIHAIALAMILSAAPLMSCAPSRSEVAGPTASVNATPDAISAAATLSAVQRGPGAGQPAVDFALKGIDGSDVTLSSLRGKGVVLVFWATWCEYCRQVLPHLAEVYEEARDDGIEMLAINQQEEPERVVAYTAEHDLPYPVLMDRDGEVADRYRVRGLPTTVFIDPGGAVQRVHLGTLEESALRDYVNALLPKET